MNSLVWSYVGDMYLWPAISHLARRRIWVWRISVRGTIDKTLEILQQGRQGVGKAQRIEGQTEAVINQVASNAVDVFLNHKDMWIEYANDEIAF